MGRPLKTVLTRWEFIRSVLVAYLVWPVYKFLIWRRNTKSVGNKQLRILVIPQINRIGDLVCATPVLKAIKDRYPESFLAVLVSSGKGGWEIIKNNPRIDQIFFYEDDQLIKKLRQGNFLWSLALTNYAIPSVLMFLSLIPNRIKTIVNPRSYSEIITDRLNNYQYHYSHHTYLPGHYLKLLEPLGIINPSETKEVFPTEVGERKAADFWMMNKLAPKDLLVGISVTAGNKIKEWGTQNFASLADELIDKYGAKIIFFGSPYDLPSLQETIGRMKFSQQSLLTTDFNVAELPSLMRRLRLFIAADTGPIYVANALGVPVVDIVGPCDPREQPPQDKKSVLVLPPSDIKPSSFVMKKPGELFEHQRATRSITVGMVLLAVERLLKKIDL